ncbi:hypothetical protein Glove_34g111 [Diversispora epigaea]|uniref:Uncharacterized protein n=1 Tax=Diversispora epigaea TaxID=1348612 RepID=A0A397JRF2_9GLOM|nr:hypothetical protein Glove_34g111 [Diversispora epigaea]
MSKSSIAKSPKIAITTGRSLMEEASIREEVKEMKEIEKEGEVGERGSTEIGETSNRSRIGGRDRKGEIEKRETTKISQTTIPKSPMQKITKITDTKGRSLMEEDKEKRKKGDRNRKEDVWTKK